MRVYLPATSRDLDALLRTGQLAGSRTGFAVTPGLREWYVDDDAEALEYAAMLEAARGSLRLLDDDPGSARRRIVVAADPPDAHVEIRDDIDRGVVRLAVPVPLDQIASFHVDDAEADTAVTAAAKAIVRADLGDDDAQAIADDAEGFELGWYARQELQAVLAALR